MSTSRLAWGAVAAAIALTQPGAASAATPLHGKILFLRCASCHDISAGPSPKIGPNLKGVLGRKAGSLPGYNYSAVMRHAGFVWTDQMLDRWLTKPTDLVPGTAMAFGGLPDAADRQAIIAYLHTTAE